MIGNISVRTYICIRTYVHIRMYTYTYTYVYVCTYVRIAYVRTYVLPIGVHHAYATT